MQDPLDVRNGICHGLLGASDDRGDASATLTWRDKDGVKSRTYDELQEMFAWLSKIPQTMAMISERGCSKDPSRPRSLPDCGFWESEFGIKFN